MKPLPVTIVTVALGAAITGVGLVPNQDEPLVITYAFSTDFEDIVAPLLDEFNEESISIDGRPIAVEGFPEASGDSRKALAAGTLRADAWTPAASVWGSVLNDTADTEATVNESADSLVLSPQVIAVWRPCADELGWTEHGQLAWNQILAVAHNKGRGTTNCRGFAMAGTYPDRSTSGLLALASWYQMTTGDDSLSVRELQRDAGAKKRVRAIEHWVSRYFETASDAMAHICGEFTPRIDALYLQENTLVANNDAECLKELVSEGMVAIYPTGGTYVADYPFYTVTRADTTSLKARAVAAMGDWLAGKLTPELAGSFGFRPVTGDPQPDVNASHGANPALPTDEGTFVMLDGEVALWLQAQWWADCGGGDC